MKTVLKNTEERMNRRIDHLNTEYAAIRAGRANPAVLDKVVVDYYGAPTPINQLAAVSVTEARTLMIQPWDASVLLIHPAVTISSHMKPNQIAFQILLYYVIGFSLSCHKNHTCYGQKQNPFDHVFSTHIQRMSCFFAFYTQPLSNCLKIYTISITFS